MTVRPALLSPLEEQRQKPLTRPVWRPATIEIGLLLIVVGLIQLAARFIHPTLSVNQLIAVNGALALLPLGLWFGISYRGEGQVRRPRTRLLVVLILTMLAANGLGVPLVERIFAVNEWLPTAGGLTRIIGYTLTVGFTQEIIKFAVLRYSVWPDQFNQRADGIAYSLAAGIGYATVLSLNLVLSEAAEPAAVALRVAGTTLSQVAVSTLLGYLLAELKLSRPAVFWLPAGVALAALFDGLFIALRAGVIVGGFSATATGNLPAASLGIALAMIAFLFSAVSFLIGNAERRERRSPEFSR